MPIAMTRAVAIVIFAEAATLLRPVASGSLETYTRHTWMEVRGSK
jgi:hypothetical protein